MRFGPPRTAEPRFANAQRAGKQAVVMRPHSLARGETGHHRLVQAARMPIVAIFDAGGLMEFGLPQACGQLPGVALRERAVDQQAAGVMAKP